MVMILKFNRIGEFCSYLPPPDGVVCAHRVVALERVLQQGVVLLNASNVEVQDVLQDLDDTILIALGMEAILKGVVQERKQDLRRGLLTAL